MLAHPATDDPDRLLAAAKCVVAKWATDDTVTVVRPVGHEDQLYEWPFDLPFPTPAHPHLHPHYRRTFDHTGRWLRKMGVITSDVSFARYQRHDVPAWSVLCYPNASPDAHELISDFISLAAQWDHLLADTQHRGTGEVMFLAMLSVLSGDLPDLTHNPYGAYVRAWADVWKRWKSGMPMHWWERSGANWRRAFEALIVEDACERDGTDMTVEEKAAIRDETGLQPLTLDAVERAGGFVVPEEALATARMRALQYHCGREVWMTNEVQSLPKEEAAGEGNLVLMLEQERHLGRTDALALIHKIVRGHTDAFLSAEAEIPGALDERGIDVVERRPVYRYIAGMRNLMAGTVAWCAHSGRYR